MPSKAVGRHHLAERIPAAFFDAADVDFRDFYVHVNDIMTHWFNAIALFGTKDKPATTPPTGADLVHFLLKDFYAVRKTRCVSDDRAMTYIICFDKSKYVPPIKAWTQAKRVKNVPSLEWDGASSIIGYNEPLPNWDSLNQNRAARYRAINDVCSIIRAELTADVFIDGKCILIIDGYSEDNETPIILPESQELYTPSDFNNRIGEGDHHLVFYTLYFTRFGKNVRSVSADTDVFLVQLMHSATRIEPDEHGVIPRTGGAAAWRNRVLHQFSPKSTAHAQVVDLNVLHDAVAEQMPTLKAPGVTTAIGVSCAANDYIRGYIGVTPKWFIEALLKHSAYIGDLLAVEATDDDVLSLDQDAYDRLIKCAYIECYMKSDAAEPRRYKWSWEKHAGNTLVLETEVLASKGKRKWPIPEQAEFDANVLHMCWDALYMQRASQAYPVIADFRKYAYEEVEHETLKRKIWQPAKRICLDV